MKDTANYEAEARISPLIPMSGRELVSTIVSGVAVGLFIAVVYFLMNQFVFSAVLCRPQSPTNCSDAPNYAMIVAMVFGAIAGIATLARLRVYRPLLVVIAVVVALWGINGLVTGLVWYWALLVAVALFGIAFGLFAWVARIRSFLLALVVTIVLIVAVRFVLVA